MGPGYLTRVNMRASIDGGQDVLELHKDLKAAGLTAAYVEQPDPTTVRATFRTDELMLAYPVLKIWLEG